MATYSLDEMYFAYDKVIKLLKAKVHVYSDSVLCLGKMHGHQDVMTKWKEKLPYFRDSKEYKELFGIDGESCEFEWNISQDTLQWKFSTRYR